MSERERKKEREMVEKHQGLKQERNYSVQVREDADRDKRDPFPLLVIGKHFAQMATQIINATMSAMVSGHQFELITPLKKSQCSCHAAPHYHSSDLQVPSILQTYVFQGALSTQDRN